jgi:hypothetical protein
MTEVRRFFRRLATFFRSGKAESDLAREINAHLRLLEDKFVAQGMTREDARYAARRAFGGVEQAKELQRDERSFRWLAGWSMDLKLGARMLLKSPGLTVTAVVALAVAIGGGAAYLEFVNDLFRPRLSFPGGDRLVGLLSFDLAKGDVEQRSLHELPYGKTSSQPSKISAPRARSKRTCSPKTAESNRPAALRSAPPHSAWSRWLRSTGGRFWLTTRSRARRASS